MVESPKGEPPGLEILADPREAPSLNRRSQDRLLLLGIIALGIFLFITSLEGVRGSFKLIFSEWQRGILAMINAQTAPIAGLAIGILGTSLVQSSSAVVAATMVSMSGMVAGGLSLVSAIRFGVPIVLGANLGTTITNTIVIFGLRRGITSEEFKSTIPGVIVDDVYEVLTITLFFTLEITTGLLSRIILALGDFYNRVLGFQVLFSAFERSIIDILIEEPITKPLTHYTMMLLGPKVGGVLLFVLWFLLIVAALSIVTKGLDRLIEAGWEEKVTSAFESPVRGFLTGFTITWLVGSSSIGTSLVIPFLATRIVNLERAYPYLVGCNVATTLDLSQMYGYFAGGLVSMMLGSAHVLLNLLAFLLFFISPLRVLPIRIAEELGRRMVRSRHSGLELLFWVIVIFFIIPILIIYLS
jgi:sodium-dependent phosphate cotransporter